jgi:hypothetical protein
LYKILLKKYIMNITRILVYKYILLILTLIFIECNHNIRKKTAMKYNLNFQTQYNQFFICDKSLSQNSISHNFWNEKAHEERLAIENNILGVRTECYGHVKGELIILKEANNIIDYNTYDHIVEGGFEIKTGLLQVLDCPNNSVELEIPLKKGEYRIRIYSSNLLSVKDDNGDDYYKIEIWKSDYAERKVLKKF